MYESLYGLNEDPFRMSLDARFSFPHHSYVEAKEYLEYGLSQGDGMLILLGEPGTGRSTVVNDLLVDHASTEILVAKLSAPPIAVDGLFQLLAHSLDVNTEGTDKGNILKSLENFLKDLHAAGRHALLIVDNAENIQEQGLEEMRLLSEARRHDQPLLQTLLQGHPKLLDVVRGSRIESLRQLILNSVQLNPMEFEETRAYVQHRLSVVGWHGDPQFSDQAIEVIHQFSAGVPRQVNVICNHLLLYGCVEQIHRFDDHDVRQVIEELPPDRIKIQPVRASEIRSSVTSATPQRETNYNNNYERSASARALRSDELKPKITRQHTPSISTPTQENTTETFTATKASFHPDSKSTAHKSVVLNTHEAPSEPLALRQLGDIPIQLKRKRAAILETPSSHRVDPSPTDFNAGAATMIARLKSPTAANPNQSAKIKKTHSRRRSGLQSLMATIILAAVLGGPYIYHTLPPDESDSRDGKSFDSNAPSSPDTDLPEPQWAAEQDQSTFSSQSQDDDRRQWPKELPDTTSEALTHVSELSDAHQRSISMATNPVMAEEISPSSLAGTDKTNTQATVDNPQGVDIDKGSSSLFDHTDIIDNVSSEANSIPVEINNDKGELTTTSARRKPLNKPSQVSLNTRDLPPTGPKHESQSMITDSGIETVGGKLVINRSLENALRRYSRQVERLSDGALIITLRRGVVFDSHSTILKQKASDTLDKLAFVLRNFNGFVLQIVIHTETRGPMENNPKLTTQRAQTIANYLVARGMPATRVQFSVQGAPAPEKHTPDFTRRPTRRVEIFVRPLV